jgi:hypothetical protein
VHIGNHGTNEKDKIRTHLRSILQSFFNMREEEATEIKREGNHIGDQAFEDHEVDKYCTRDYYELLAGASSGSVFRFTHY